MLWMKSGIRVHGMTRRPPAQLPDSDGHRLMCAVLACLCSACGHQPPIPTVTELAIERIEGSAQRPAAIGRTALSASRCPNSRNRT